MRIRCRRRIGQRRGRSFPVLGLVCVVLFTGCGRRSPSAPDAPDANESPTSAASAVVLVAGDIAQCGVDGAARTARLLDTLEGTVLTAGDNAYPHGSARDFEACYTPTWGRHRARTRPSPGNHDYETPGAAGYFAYFGENAGPAGLGYYSFDAGSWHIVSLNSNVSMTTGSAQERWLATDLAMHARACVLAYWHHPRFSSGPHGNDARSHGVWQTLHAAGADIVVNGHDHTYERFAPQDPFGSFDLARGVRQFVVGTGGASLYQLGAPRPNSEARNDRTWGVLRLELESGGYRWRFMPAEGGTFTDEGLGRCSS